MVDLVHLLSLDTINHANIKRVSGNTRETRFALDK